MAELRPAELDRPSALVIAIARVAVGLLWLQNVAWKIPPDFGRDRSDDLYRFTRYAVEYPVLPPYSWLVENLVLPNFTLFGWFTLLTESTLGVMLVLGLGVRTWALVGAGMSAVIGATVLFAPHEWHWSYYLMVAAHLLLWAIAAGRCYGLDAVLAPRPLGQWRSWSLRGPAEKVSAAIQVLAVSTVLWAPFLLSGPTQFRLIRVSGQAFALLAVAAIIAWFAARRSAAAVTAVGALLVLAAIVQVVQVRAEVDLIGGGLDLGALLLTYGVGYVVLGRARR